MQKVQKSNPNSLRKKAVGGTIWAVFGFGSQQGLRFAGNLVLTRLLTPEIFGLMALVRVMLTGLELFSDVGLRPNVIRSPRGEEPTFLNTAWTIQVLRGCAIGICGLILALPISAYYEEPRLRWLVPAVSLASVIAGLTSTSLLVLSRRMQVRSEAFLNLAASLVNLATIISWALFVNPNVWALVVGTLAAKVFQMVCSHLFLARDLPRNHFAWDRSSAREIFSFGRWIFISTIMTYLASQCDRLILGNLLTLEQFGIYSLALLMSEIPVQLIGRLSGSVIMPVLARKLDTPRDELRQKVRRVRGLLLVALACGLAPVAAFADLAVDILFDDRYVQVGWILSILTLGIWPRVLTRSSGSALIAFGRPIYGAIGNFTKFAYLLIALPLGYQTYGFLGVVIIVALNDLSGYLIVQYGLSRERMALPYQDIFSTLFMLGLTALLVFARLQFGWGSPLDGIVLSS